MKTIVERAKLASEGYDDDGYSAGLYMGYVEGAKAQKRIDIDKACEWLMTNLEIPEDGVISEEEGKELLGDKPVTFIGEFRKAMEE